MQTAKTDQTGRMHAQADLSLRWAHGHFVGFVMSWLSYNDGNVMSVSKSF